MRKDPGALAGYQEYEEQSIVIFTIGIRTSVPDTTLFYLNQP